MGICYVKNAAPLAWFSYVTDRRRLLLLVISEEYSAFSFCRRTKAKNHCRTIWN